MSYNHVAHSGSLTTGGASQLAHKVAETVSTMYRRSVDRHQLRQLDQRMLADIGLSRVEAEREASKPFWKA